MSAHLSNDAHDLTGLPIGDKYLLTWLAWKADDDGNVERSTEEMMAATGWEARNVRKALDRLRQAGHITGSRGRFLIHPTGPTVPVTTGPTVPVSGPTVPVERSHSAVNGSAYRHHSAVEPALQDRTPSIQEHLVADVRTTDNKGAQLVETATTSDSTTRVDNSTTNGVDRSSMTGTQVAQRNSLPDWAQRSIITLNPGITVTQQTEWDSEWHHLTVDLHHEDSVSVHDSLSAYLNYCRNKTLIPIPSRFEQWYLKDQRDYSAAVAAQRPVEHNPNDDFRITYRRDWDADLGITS